MPLNLRPSVSGGAISLKVYNPSTGDKAVPSGDSVRDYYHPPTGGGTVEARVLDDGATEFTVTNADGSTWTRPAGVDFCSKQLTVPSADNAELSYAVTIAATGATTRNQTIIIKRKPL